jgi:hypothetical protein
MIDFSWTKLPFKTFSVPDRSLRTFTETMLSFSVDEVYTNHDQYGRRFIVPPTVTSIQRCHRSGLTQY